MKSLLVTLSIALTSAVIRHALNKEKQFYQAAIYIMNSNTSMAVIYIQFVVVVYMLGILFGKTVRVVASRNFAIRLWRSITNVFFTFTEFRFICNSRPLSLLTVLLFMKSFHVLADKRVELIPNSAGLGLFFHVRIVSLLVLLGTMDYMLILESFKTIAGRSSAVQIFLGFEYSGLVTTVVAAAMKYLLHSSELLLNASLKRKMLFLLVTKFLYGLSKVVMYLGSVMLIFNFHVEPSFSLHPSFYLLSFRNALSRVFKSGRAIRMVDTLYPDATAEELSIDDKCCMCWEEMLSDAKKLPCGHIFHAACLRSWFRRQQTCPTCRFNVLSPAAPTAEGVAAAAALQVPLASSASSALQEFNIEELRVVEAVERIRLEERIVLLRKFQSFVDEFAAAAADSDESDIEISDLLF